MAGPARENASYFENVRTILALDEPAGDKVVLLYLHDRQGSNGCSWPSLTTIARDCNMARSTVAVCIGRLKDKNLIEAERPEKPSKKVEASNHYTICLTGPKIGPVRKSDQSGNRTATSPEIGPQLVRKSDPNVSDNGSLNDSQTKGEFSKGDLSKKTGPTDKAVHQLLLTIGVRLKEAGEIVYDRKTPPQTVIQAVKNAEVKARAGEIDKDIAAYVVGTLKQARNEDHPVTPNKAAKKREAHAAKIKRDSTTPRLAGKDLKNRHAEIAIQCKALQDQG